VALGWLTWELTESYKWLGIIAFTDLFVMILFVPLAGVLADRMDRLRLSMWAQCGQLAQALAVAFLVFTGWSDSWSLLILTGLLGAAHAYHAQARLALVPNMVPKEDLTPAIAINSVIFNVGRFLGPAVAGLIIVNFGVGPAFLFNAATFVVFIWVLLRVRMMRIEAPPKKDVGTIASIAEGMRYGLRHPGIGPILIMLAATALTGRSLPDLLPGFADGVFHRGPEGLAWLTSAMGLGAMTSSLVLLARNGVHGLTALTIQMLLALGASTLLFVLIEPFWGAVAMILLVGFTMNLTGITALNLMQNAVAGEIRGRVMSLYTLLHQGAPALGTLLMGVAAEYTGLAVPVGVTAVLTALVGLALLPRFHVMRQALESDAPPPVPGAART
jgi:predicted MFS family arabinose efflux permease